METNIPYKLKHWIHVENIDKEGWELLSSNPYAIELLKANPDKYVDSLSYNVNAIDPYNQT